jgi:hypothetical protein
MDETHMEDDTTMQPKRKGGRQPGNPKRSSARIGGGRTKLEIERDRALMAELNSAGKTDQQIAEILNAREDVGYTLARRTITKDRNDVLDNYNETHQSETKKAIAKRLKQVEKAIEAAWDAYLASLEPAISTEVRDLTVTDGRSDPDKIKEYTEKESKTFTNHSARSAQFLAVYLKGVDQAAKLEGLYRLSIDIKKEESITHHVKMYQVVSPEDWDEPELLEGEYE